MRISSNFTIKNLVRGLSLVSMFLVVSPAMSADQADQDIPDEIVKKVDPSVVAIQHEMAVGSGFIVTKDGYILSNGHVVRGNDKEDPTEPAKSVTVILNDERKFPAKVIGFCMNPDVAVLKIDCGEPLTPVEFGDSTNAHIGQKVFAVGTPHGLKRTFSSGILSNVDRTDLDTFTKVFQTDAAINPGNSGGPLFDRNGRVLGINTYGASGANNLGFTIPIHVVEKLYNDIREHGHFVRADVPVFFARELYDELASALGVQHGVLVEYVMENTPAEASGLKAGDVIVEMNGNPVSARTKAELKDVEWNFTIMKPGSKVTWTVLRQNGDGHERVKVEAKLEEAEPMTTTSRFPGELKIEKYDALGLSFQRIVREHRIIYSLQDDPGVLVVGVDKGTPAEKAELGERDIITSVGDTAVSDVDSFCKAIEANLAKGEKYIDLVVRRQQHVWRTALAPYYDLKGKRVAVLLPPGEPRYLDIVLRELTSQGASLTLASPGGKIESGCPAVKAQVRIEDLKSDDIDILLILDGDKAEEYWENKAVVELVKAAYKSEKMLAAVGASAITLVAAEPALLEKKMTASKTYSGEAIKRKAQYTGSDVEKDAGILTTTGFDRQVMRDFLKGLGRAE